MTIWISNLSKALESGTGTGARYMQLATAIEEAINDAGLAPGDRLPTHRALADKLGVTVGTITRGYAEAERRGLVEARVGSGTFIRNALASADNFAILRHTPSELIEFSLNLPVPSDANKMFGEVLQELAGEVGQDLDFLSYQPEQGLPQQRQWAAQWLASFGLNHPMEQITITCGGQHAIMLAMMASTRAGDTILSEGLTYPGMNAIAKQLSLKVIGLPMDEQGVIPEAMEEQCKLHTIRALYCTPTIQNPSNATMGLERRHAIIDIAKRYKLWLIEDEVSSNQMADKLPPLSALAPDRCLYINSHSKTVAAGLRVGYLATPPQLVDNVAAAIQAQCWFAPPITVEIAQRWMRRRDTEAWLAWQSEQLQQRRMLAERYLSEYLMIGDCRTMAGSMSVWLNLPEPWRAVEFRERLHHKGVAVLAAESFAVGRFPAPQAVRISISAPPSLEQVEQGLRIIAELLESGPSQRIAAI